MSLAGLGKVSTSTRGSASCACGKLSSSEVKSSNKSQYVAKVSIPLVLKVRYTAYAVTTFRALCVLGRTWNGTGRQITINGLVLAGTTRITFAGVRSV